ncbi:hypothetical protein GVv1_35800 [Enterobacter pseudoroggenkampii]
MDEKMAKNKYRAVFLSWEKIFPLFPLRNITSLIVIPSPEARVRDKLFVEPF